MANAQTAINAAATANGWTVSTAHGIDSWFTYQRGEFKVFVQYTKTGRVSYADHKRGDEARGLIAGRLPGKRDEVLSWIQRKAK